MHWVSVTAGRTAVYTAVTEECTRASLSRPPVATSRTPPVHVQSASLAVRLPRTWGMTTPQGYP